MAFNSIWTENFQIYKLGLEKAEEPEIKLPTSFGSQKKTREFQKNIYFCITDYAKAFDCVDHNKLWKILKEMRIPDYLSWLLENLYAGQEATEPDMEQQTGSKLGKEYIKAVYCHSAYLTSMQSTWCKLPGWMYHKLESRLPGEISTTSDMQIIPIAGTCMLSCFSHVQLCSPLDCSPPGSTVQGILRLKNTGVSCHALLQGIFLTQRWNQCLLCLLQWQEDS